MEDHIPFYGSTHPEIFAIERASMDRRGAVIDFLNAHLPAGGVILDVGAGDGYTAARITRGTVLCVEPDPGMIDRANYPLWVRGTAEALPLHDASVDAAYATWAYFLPGVDKAPGVAELERVIRPGGVIVLVDNAGGDEFEELLGRPITEGPEFYQAHGFDRTILETSFEFETLEQARRLFELYLSGDEHIPEELGSSCQFRVAAYTKTLPS